VDDPLAYRQRLALVGVAFAVASLLFAGMVGVGGTALGAVAGLALIVICSRLVPRFWRTVGLGAIAGAVCGALVLAPGFRLAMRVVAILDPVRTPAFTIEGTLFIILFLGVVVGGVFGIEAALLRRALSVSAAVMTFSMTAVIMGLLLAGDDLRSEVFELGAGAWLNIPMFAMVVWLYSWALNRAIDRVGVHTASSATPEPAGMQAWPL
jgi:hypothetical protein